MKQYTANDVLRVAKRLRNSSRAYLLVNPLQAKHLPVSPTRSLRMMRSFGEGLAAKYPDTGLVVGFAETATAIGAVVARCFGDGCSYLHTTREDIPAGREWVLFHEEHSHAVEQKLCLDHFAEQLADKPRIIFVEDELSTGKTIANMAGQLRRQCPQFGGIEMVAASIVNRLSEENLDRLAVLGIVCEQLVKLPDADFSAQVADLATSAAREPEAAEEALYMYEELTVSRPLADPRIGVGIREYGRGCAAVAEEAVRQLSARLPAGERILVLGTEECMYPALVLGEHLERSGLAQTVLCHATTRSPICISGADGYPISEGHRLRSLYDPARETFLYNLAHYDAVVVVTDAPQPCDAGLSDIAAALRVHGCGRLFLLKGGARV